MSNRFHFAKGGSVDEQTVADVQKLNAFNEPALEEFVELVWGFLQNQHSPSSFMTIVEDFAGRSNVNPGALKKILRAFLVVARGAVRSRLAANLLADDLLAMGVSESRSQLVASVYKKEEAGLSRAVSAQALSVNPLVDMEWKFGVCAGNSDVKTVGDLYVQMRLTVDKGGDDGLQSVPVEFRLNEFYKFMTEIEKAKVALDQF